MEIKIAVVDDLQQDRDKLGECIGQFFDAHKDGAAKNVTARVHNYASAEDFLPTYEPGKFDLVFLDICMNEMDGIELAGKLREADAHLLIVFQTTERAYAFDAFPVHPFDYLIKPCRQDEVGAVLKEALRVLEAGDPEIEVNAIRAKFKVPLRSIVAVSSQGHNTELSLTNKQSMTTTESFKAISSKIENDKRFLTINRGVIINMDHVLAPEGDVMKMQDGSTYPIKVNGRAAVLTAFSQYMISRMDKGL